ncbi:AraC family transcriptional regulator [Paenibacillus sp. GCM10023248]|uniref:helix-turn-helix transcriptional regulator n=1 Tax=unclassified Paenibacillus TaxID=185978 RepID=UPI00237870BF|nr:AraC family transcriptional regulator [Paenibacillus sp. MAHUQ-63]MDD9269114.1 AraC family transcriptional regulator [Paenibacillus sp. MAHUQ-63]
MMPFLLAELVTLENIMPLYVYCVGSHEQKHLKRPDGYPAQQLFLSRSGRGTFRLEGGPDMAMTPGTMLILPAGVPHEYDPAHGEDAWELGFAAFSGSAAASIMAHLGCREPVLLEKAHFAALWDKLESLWQHISLNGESGYWEASRRMYDMLLTVLQGQSDQEVKQRMTPAGQPNAALQEAVKLIHDHYNERLHVSNLARAVGYSVQHFHRLFVDSYGVTPQQYIQQIRMRRSVQLFQENPGMTVEKIAHQLGMEPSYFIRIFKRTYGETPKQFMKRS